MNNTDLAQELFERFIEDGPDSRMELISNRLILGGSSAGSLSMLGHILAGWGVEAAIPLAPQEKWEAALAEVSPGDSSGDNERAPLMGSASARRPGLFVSQLRADLHLAFHRAAQGLALGRDFVMRLGEDGFTPDLLFIGDRSQSVLYESHLEGPADLVIEICGDWNNEFLRLRKERYAAGGVRELWLVDPERRQVEMLRLGPDGCLRWKEDSQGCYRPAIETQISFYPATLWTESKEPEHLVRMRRGANSENSLKAIDDRDAEWLPFAPRIELTPEPIGFREFLSWAPEAKFEWFDNRPQIGGREGTRNTLAMLLMTFGLNEAVKLRPASEWRNALRMRRES